MLATVRLASRRKRSLLNCGWVRLYWPLLDAGTREAVEEAERLADGIGPTPTAPIPWAVRLPWGSFGWHVDPKHSGWYGGVVSSGMQHALTWHEPEGSRTVMAAGIRRVQARITRCVFGNPFRPVAADPRWVTPTVAAQAEAIYADRAIDRLTELADCLDGAGCAHADILIYCREEGPHVRGCWVVDQMLGKN